jgi:VCBS repeat-containing protein
VHYDAAGQIEFGTRFVNNYLDLVADSTTSTTISYPDFSDPTGLNLIRDAAIANGNTLRLTPAASGKEGAAWYTAEKQFVALPWETSFDFNLNENSGGTSGGSDGFTFAIQNFDPTYLAGGGHHMGYTSLANSLVVEFDTVQKGGSSGSLISVHTNGTGPNGWEESLSLGSFNTSTPLDDATTHTAKIRYTNGELSVFLDNLDNPVLVVPVDLASLLDLDQGRAWVGFTATTGGGYQNHDILNWSHKVFADSSTTVAVSDAALIEGSSGVSQMVFDVTRLGDTSGITTVDWATSDATATSGIDYIAASGSVSFAPGETHKTVSVEIHGDTVDEAHETLFVKLLNPVGGSIADATGIGTILNDDSTISISDATATEGDASYRFIDDFVAARGGMIAEPFGVAFGPDGNLYVGHHGLGVVKRFDGLTGQFMGVFADGSDVAEEVSQVLFHDGYLFAATGSEGILRFDATTGGPAPAVGKPGAQFATPADQGLLVGVHSFAFGPDGHLYLTGRSSNQILRYDGASGEFLDTFVVADGNSARITFGTDGHLYSGVNNAVMRYQGPLEANPGTFIDTFVSSENMGISPIPTGGLKFGPSGDLFVVRRDTNTVLRFDGATGAFRETVVEPGEGGVSSPRGIAFDSEGRLYVASGISNEILRYGPTLEAAFTISLSNPSALAVDVTYSTANGSGLAGFDYQAVSGTLTFAPGQTSRTIAVQTVDDTVHEGTEAFSVNLSNASGGEIVNSQGIGTILDDDPSQPPTANSDSYNTTEDTPLIVPASGVLANDTDPENALLTAVLVTTTSHGALTLNANGSFSYSPHDNFFGSDSFTYRANDGTSDSNLATVTISVSPVNDAPVAAADGYTVDQDSVLSIAAQGVLSNDSDVDGDTLTAIAWSGNSAQGGQVVLNSNGSFTYTPPTGFSGTDTFSYRASDGSLTSNWATVSIAVEADNVNAMYVYDIRFESRYWGLQRRAVFEIRWDSNGDGQGGSADARRAGVSITVEFAGQTYSGTTDANGLFRTSWIGNPGSGTYAEVVDMALVDFVWNPLALDLEDDTDGDGRPDAQL